jgi:hypothetical protein
MSSIKKLSLIYKKKLNVSKIKKIISIKLILILLIYSKNNLVSLNSWNSCLKKKIKLLKNSKIIKLELKINISHSMKNIKRPRFRGKG